MCLALNKTSNLLNSVKCLCLFLGLAPNSDTKNAIKSFIQVNIIELKYNDRELCVELNYFRFSHSSSITDKDIL